MKFFYLLTLLPVAFTFVVDDGCGKYDRSDRLGICGKGAVCGDVCGDTRICDYGKYNKQAQDEICADYDGKSKYDISDNDFRADNYCLDADMCARGRFCGCGNDDRGRCFEQVAKFRRGAGYNNCGKRKQYSDYDTCGKLKRYADKNWHAKVGLTGRVRAGGKYDLTGKGSEHIEFSDFDNFNAAARANNARDVETGNNYAIQGAADVAGDLQARAGFGRNDRYERHDEVERIPDLCGKCYDRCGRRDTCYPCRWY